MNKFSDAFQSKAAQYAAVGVVAGVVVWLVYKFVTKAGGAVASVVNETISKPIADVYSWATLPSEIQSATLIRLPTGELVAPERGEFLGYSGGVSRWEFRGRVYTVSPRNADGIYPAT